MTDTHDDPFGTALATLTAEERQHFREIADALVEAADAAAVAPGWTLRAPADSWRMLAVHFRERRDPVWCALSAAAARADEIGGR
ncbi:hypothetical protein [Streptomyces sp. MZ04]|uniref:hypothetical protein n=1 Tax=Streptomyces sp. MZ04 TaxID=2559236 RepID=UPI00107EC4C2|nr:hypothetical protein [Streptomyces sp. MZ04]TGB13297.1 hypothetical protein E2651_09800 [Streptomyces sp. MZ04]